MKSVTSLLVLLGLSTAVYAQEQAPPKRIDPLRVLLFAGGPSREYQALRQMLARESDKIHLSTFLQDADGKTGQKIDGERILTEFPALYKSSTYDLVIAIDSDWSAVPAGHLRLLYAWIDREKGGLLVVAGPVNTPRTGNFLLPLLPIRLDDPKTNPGVKSGGPYALKLMDAGMVPLRLDTTTLSYRVAWEKYFWNGMATDDKPPVRGFYSAFPVGQEVGARAKVFAYLIDDARIEHPFFASHAYGKGTVIYVGAPELWRLRAYKEEYHRQLWLNLIKEASGANSLTLNSWIGLPQRIIQGETIRIEVRLVDEAGKPIDIKARPTLKIIQNEEAQKQHTIALTPRKSAERWAGWFEGSFSLSVSGPHTISVKGPGAKNPRPLQVAVMSLFEAEIKSGAWLNRQWALTRRSQVWRESVLKLAKHMDAEKNDAAIRREAKVYKDAIDATIKAGWGLRTGKLNELYQTLQRGSLPPLAAARDESQLLTDQLRAMRLRLLGKDQPKDPKETLALLRKSIDHYEAAPENLGWAVGDAEMWLRDHHAQRYSAKEQAAQGERLVKQFQEFSKQMKATHERYRQTIQALINVDLRPETFRYQRRQSAVWVEFLDNDFDRAIASLRVLQKKLATGEFADRAEVARVEKQFEVLRSAAWAQPVPPDAAAIFIELIQLELQQVEQTRIVTALHKQREAELLRELLEK